MQLTKEPSNNHAMAAWNISPQFLSLRKKRTIFWLAAAAAVIGFCSLGLYNSQRRTRVFLVSSSPSGTYQVTLSGQSDRPKVPMVDHVVLLSATKHGRTVLSGKELYSGDWFDASFAEWYPQHQWVSDQCLQFYRDQFRKDLPNDIIILKNDSLERITYLKVVSVDIVVVLDLDPQATATFLVSRARTDSKWTSVEGEFEGGKQISGAGMNFDVPKRRGSLSLQILISERGTTITPMFSALRTA